MDQRATILEQDIKDILETRLEIGRKIQLLDEQARWELENVKAKWSGLTTNVAEAGRELMDLSTRTMNPARQLTMQPWAALAGVVLFGYAIGIIGKRYRRGKVYPYAPPKAHGVPVMPAETEGEQSDIESGVYPYFPDGRQGSHQGSSQESKRGRTSFVSEIWNEVKGNVGAEMERSKDVIRQAVGQFARDTAKEVVPTILKMMMPHSRR
jgi:hypothetical protein